ncbi:MAG: uracil-DNA glycosylase family protein [Verrucomicrobiales bacterium]
MSSIPCAFEAPSCGNIRNIVSKRSTGPGDSLKVQTDTATMFRALNALHALRSHLGALEEKGVKRLWLSPGALETLGDFRRRLAQPRGRNSTTQPLSETAPAPSSPRHPVAGRVREQAVAPPTKPSNRSTLTPAGTTPAEKLDSLRQMALHYGPARDLGTLRDTMVFATGDPEADLMFVGEAPGAQEETLGEPFVGKAGQLLTKIIAAMGLSREGVYISNIVKFRPAMPNQGSGNRKPSEAEMAACLPFILAEIEIVRPRVIVALGASAAAGLLDLHDPVSRMRRELHQLNGIPLAVTYHPSYLLRNQAHSERRKVWEDILVVMEKLGLPISEKQRRFFQK